MSLTERAPLYFLKDLAKYSQILCEKIGQLKINTFAEEINDDMDQIPFSIEFGGDKYHIKLEYEPRPIPPFTEDAINAIREFLCEYSDLIGKLYIMWVTKVTLQNSFLRHTMIYYDKENMRFVPSYTDRFSNRLANATALRKNIENQLQSEEYKVLSYRDMISAQNTHMHAINEEERLKSFDEVVAAREFKTINSRLENGPYLYFVIHKQ